ncbi:hypothetical protein B0H13DRAFT_1952651 [Mycena leptocephala]|nr:hypothetical protein B0H13DRAFT_1952651 [Mycena leptocephala]
MAPKIRRIKCQICSINESKYTCSGCTAVYCSVPCYKKHKEVPYTQTVHPDPSSAEPPLSDDDAPPLRPLTSLRWPYVPEESAYPDPLKRDDPKPLQTPQYEAIAARPDREDALQRALGVTAPAIASSSTNSGGGGVAQLSEDVLALRALAEAVEAAVRGGKADALGLDWGE